MRSNELAKLAGVSVRTLRHYHAIGLMEEPPRSENGYRNYEVDDVVRLLRIKRLTTLGFSLARIGDVLDEMDSNLAASAGPNTDAALDELDRELALQIERLQEQRRTIAQLKNEQLDPDLPTRFARAAKTLIGNVYIESSISDNDRKALLIAGHLYTEDDIEELERTVTALTERGLLEQLHHVQGYFDNLKADATREEIELAVREVMDLLDPIIDCFDPALWEQTSSTKGEELINDLVRRDLNEAQALATDLYSDALTKRILARKPNAAGAAPPPYPHHKSLDPDLTS